MPDALALSRTDFNPLAAGHHNSCIARLGSLKVACVATSLVAFALLLSSCAPVLQYPMTYPEVWRCLERASHISWSVSQLSLCDIVIRDGDLIVLREYPLGRRFEGDDLFFKETWGCIEASGNDRFRLAEDVGGCGGLVFRNGTLYMGR